MNKTHWVDATLHMPPNGTSCWIVNDNFPIALVARSVISPQGQRYFQLEKQDSPVDKDIIAGAIVQRTGTHWEAEEK